MLKSIIFLVFCAALCYGACVSPLANALVPTGYCASIWASGLSTPRGITTASNGDVIVVERGQSRLSLFYKNSGGTLTKVTLATATGLNHAVIIRDNYIYASSASTVFRWRYYAGNRTNLGTAQTVITGIPTGGHATRSLAFTNAGLLLVQVGSDANVDTTDARAGIRQFDITTIPKTFSSGAWFARGLRNEAGIRADSSGTVWGIENGMDNLNRADLGGDIHLGNPGEELNKFSTVGKFYGYPYCWSQYNLSTVTTPRGTQYGLAPFLTDGTHTDAWCQNTNNVVKPAYQLHPHTAPLDLLFYYGTSFPGYNNSLFVAQHGSWNSAPAVGYRVSRITFSGGNPVSDTPFLWYVGPGQTGTGWHRPVALTLIKDGTADVLLVTSDATNVIISVRYSP